MPQWAEGAPTKEFFVRTIVKDITLQDCILDLLDNCLDGARRSVRAAGPAAQHGRFDGFGASLTFNPDGFLIEDNCGGIPIDNALQYAFRFGRRPDAPAEGEFAIGLYGIGMKRALFKMGVLCEVNSSTGTEAFSVKIDVDEWLRRPQEWNFELEPRPIWQPGGTRVSVTQLNREVATDFADPVFAIQLQRTISRDYSFFLQKGFSIALNGSEVSPYNYALREGGDFQPIRFSYTDEMGVEVEIFAGMAGLPPEGVAPDDGGPTEVDYYGWFVACNDRIVLPADKTSATVWGDEFPGWHYQYNGFMGIVNFRSSDPRLLPWTTTKREVDSQNPVYRRAVTQMKRATRAYIDYTNARKDDPEEAKRLESATVATPISQLQERAIFILPKLSRRPNVEMANISYAVEKVRAVKVAEALGSRFMHNKQIGLKTFEYYYQNEIGEE